MTNRLVDTVLIYQPGGTRGPTIATDWAEVAAEIAATKGALSLFIDTSQNGGKPARVPTSAGVVECFGRLRLYGSRLDALETSSELIIEDGAQLLNVLSISHTLKVSCESLGLPGLAIDYDPGKEQFILLEYGGRIANTAVQARPLFQVPAGRTLRLALQYGAGIITSAQPAMPIVQLDVGSTLEMFVQDLGSLAADFVSGPVGSNLQIEHDANFSPAPQAGMLGTITLQRSTKQEQIRPHIGGTFNRPADALIGQMYFDQDLDQPIWWDGTKWVNGVGPWQSTRSQTDNFVPVAVNQWVKNTPFALLWTAFNADPTFKLDTTTGEIKYLGQPADFAIFVALSVGLVLGVGPDILEFVVDQNNVLVGGAAITGALNRVTATGSGAAIPTIWFPMTLVQHVHLVPNDVLNIVGRNRTSLTTINVTTDNLVITKLG